MPRRRKYTAIDFPQPGTVLSFQVADGRFGACRVLRVDTPFGSDSFYALVALSKWIDQSPPPLNHPDVRSLLHLTHHAWSNRPEIIWIGEPPPSSFRAIGNIPITKQEADLDSGTFAAWKSFPLQALLQWRWDHDREALFAEEAVKTAQLEKKRAAVAARRAKILETITLPSILQRPTLFPRWKNYPPRAIKSLIEQPIRAFVATIIQLKNPTRRDVTRELRLCAKTLNNIDSSHGHPIETVERDDIFELFEEILTAAKHPDLLDKLDEWRDW